MNNLICDDCKRENPLKWICQHKTQEKPVFSPEHVLRVDIEDAVIRASDGIHDSTEWWDGANRGADGNRPIETLINDIAKAAGEFADASKPRYMDRPDEPGVWVCFNDSREFPMTVLYLSQEDIDRGAPFRTHRVYGPIPDFHPSKGDSR